MSETSLISQLYLELKKDEPDRNRVIELARNVPLDSLYNGVDALTFSIFYQSKPAFHILLNRGINPNPTIYKDIPPLLWSLEIPNKYFFQYLIKKTKVNLYHIEDKYGENLLSNICLKLQDTWLFRMVFRRMIRQDSTALQSLMSTRVVIDDERMYPIEICFYTLNSRLVNGYNQDLEHACFQKVQTLLEYQMSTMDIEPLRVLDITTSFPNIMKHNTCLIQKILEFLKVKHNIPQLLENNPLLIKKCIDENSNLLPKILIPMVNFKESQLLEFLQVALDARNYQMILYLHNLGVDINKIENKKDLLVLVISADQLDLYQKLTQGEYKYHIWTSKTLPDKTLKLPFAIDVNYRALHLACLFQAINIAEYLIYSLGDSLSYRGQTKLSPQDILDKGVCIGKISQSFANELTSPRITYQDFQKQDKLKQEECCICLDSLCGNEITMLECGHAFHASCLRKNKKSSMECPYCRSHVIHKYKCNAQVAFLEPKIIEKPKWFCTSNSYQTNVCIPVKSKTTEDAETYNVYYGKKLEELELEKHKKLRTEFLEQMEIQEKPILLEKVRSILVKYKIGLRPKNMKPSSRYNFRNPEDYHHPPGTPVPRKRTPITPATLQHKYDIYQSNIITGKRTTRGKRPNFLLDSI